MEHPRPNPLLASDDAWEHRRGHARTWWALLISVALHAAAFYFADELLEVKPLRTVQSPFLVSLVVPEPETRAPAEETSETPEKPEAATTAELEPAQEQREVADEEVAAEPHAPVLEKAEEELAGEPDAPALETPESERPQAEQLEQPPRGDSTLVEPGPPGVVRRDVAGEAARRLLEEMESVTPLPRSLGEQSTEGEQRPLPEDAPRGASAGIEGPLGERGLLYVEYPPTPAWAQEAGIEAEVRFRFWVSPAGNVIRIRAVRKSAYPEFESLAREALSRWRFEPLPRGAQRDEWGEVPIIWRLQRPGPQDDAR